jgi:hypothetical protein
MSNPGIDLYKQALQFAYTTAGNTSDYSAFESVVAGKLSELIAQRCAQICEDVGFAILAEERQSNLGTAQTCRRAILKHFEIDE